jgi:hypothetical protein
LRIANIKYQIEDEARSPTRREWITDGVRYAALTALSVWSGAMLVRSATASHDSTCGFALGCNQCAELNICGRPQALRLRREADAHG